MENKVEKCEAFEVNIYIAGDTSVAESVCRKYCADVGLCVTVTPTKYVYSWGAEDGAIIGLINYARFPDIAENIEVHGEALGNILMDRLVQRSFSLTTPTTSKYYAKDISNGR